MGPLLFVTARSCGDPILKWIHHYLPDVDRDSISLEATSSSVEKLPVLRKYGIRYFVDDRLETGYLLEQNRITPIIFEQPWNRKPHFFPVVRDWDDISSLIEW
jgi:hypothetical protein